MEATKDSVVRALIGWHFNVEPGLREVFWIRSGHEDDPSDPVRLLEVNAATFPTGSVEPFRFAPSSEVPCFTTIAEITPDELDAVRAGTIPLPAGWSLAEAQLFLRPTGT